MSSDQVVAGDAAREPAVRRALESVAELERTLGPDHPDTLNLRWLTSFVGTQLVPFAGRMSVLRVAGQPAVRVVFSQPSPLGLLSHA